MDKKRPRSSRARASGMLALFSPKWLAAGCDIITQCIYVAIQNSCCKCSSENSKPVWLCFSSFLVGAEWNAYTACFEEYWWLESESADGQ